VVGSQSADFKMRRRELLTQTPDGRRCVVALLCERDRVDPFLEQLIAHPLEFAIVRGGGPRAIPNFWRMLAKTVAGLSMACVTSQMNVFSGCR